MTDLDLDAIEARANAAMLSPTGQQYDAAVVLSTDVPALVAEVRRLREDADEDASVRDMLASLLTSTANALKGEPEQLWMHDWSDLPQVAGQHAAGLRTLSDTVALLTRERGELLAAIDRLTGALAAIGVLPSASKPVRDIVRDALLDGGATDPQTQEG